MNKILPIILVFVFGIADAADYSFTKQQKRIFQQVFSMEINKELHQRFWNDIPRGELAKIKKNSNEFVAQFDEIFLVAPKWQQSIWESVLLSYNNKKITKTSSYINLSKKYKNNRMFKKGIINAERLMKAAATRTPMQTDRGTMHVSSEMANQVLSNLDKSMQRAKILFDPNYYD